MPAACASLQALDTDEITTTGSSSNSGPVSKLISATDGGAITSSDGKLTLNVPAGALSEDTEITVAPIEVDGVVIGYDFFPDGLVFNQPATFDLEMDLDERDEIVDENGEVIDTDAGIPSTALFLKSADGSLEMIDNVHVTKEEGSSSIHVKAEIPHFTSMISSVGNSYYVYMTSLGTHYVGSDFKADITVRYLGFETTSTYKDMSIRYKVRSITVNKIKIEDSGAIDRVTPEEITRSAFLSNRGDESATRPKFNCQEVGNGTVTVTVSVSATVEVEFQPENLTRVFTINQSESTTRKGKCIASVGLLDNYNDGGSSEQYAVNDPSGDTLVAADDTYVAANGLDVPGYADITSASVQIINGDTVSFNMQLNGDVPLASSEETPAICFHLMILDDSVGLMGFPYDNTALDISIEAMGTGTELAAILYDHDGEFLTEQENAGLDMNVDGQSINVLIPLASLDMTEEDFANSSFRVVSQATVLGQDGFNAFVDTLEFDLGNTI